MPNNSIIFKALIPVFAATLILTTPYRGGNAARPANQAPGDAGQGVGDRYHVVHGWPVLPQGFIFGHVTGVGVDSHNHVFVFHRADHSVIGGTFTEPISSPVILCFDARTGALVTSWGANTFLIPHGLRVDQDDNIWVTDIELQQVLKFTHDGRLLMAVGEEGVAGLDGTHFNEPTDVAVAPDGSFYVSDGEGNSRVAKFSANGKFLFDWGQKGDQPGEFNTPHGIAMDREGRIYVADRGNGRIQVFKGDGTFLHLWESPELGRPWALSFGPDGRLYVVDGGDLNPWPPDHSHIHKLDTDGNILETWSTYGNYDGQLFWGHDIALGRDGAVYVGDIQGRRVQKFARWW